MRNSFEPQPFRDVRELWHVVFVGDLPGDPHSYWRWWRVFTLRSYKHCFAAKAIVVDGEVTQWLMVSGGVFFLTCELLEVHDERGQSLSTTVSPGNMPHRILCWPFAPESRYYNRGMITCVSQIKYLLGLRCFSVMRPAGLYRWMAQNGAFPLEDYDG